MTRRFVGVDVGGTKIAAAVVDPAGSVLNRRAVPTPRTGGMDVLASAANLVEGLLRDEGGTVVAVGFGVPGVVDALGTVVSATGTLPGWSGTAAGSWLAERLGLPVVVDNDVRMLAVGEASLGAGRGYADALFVSVGTGVGGAYLRGGAVWRGPHGTAGALAHLLVPGAGSVACGCGRDDHLEAQVAGPAIAAAYQRRRGGDRVALTDVAARMRAGDADAAAVIVAAGRLLGRALAGLLAAVDADVVVVGGGVAEIGQAFVGSVAQALREEALPPLAMLPVRAAQLGTAAPLVGAAISAQRGTVTA